jgi:hypothetical protein
MRTWTSKWAPSLEISGGEDFATSKVGGQGKSLLPAKMVHRWAKRAESLVVCATKLGEHGRVYRGGFLQELLVRWGPEKVLNWNIEESGNFEQNDCAGVLFAACDQFG